MAELTGSEILAKALKKEGTENLFFIMGGPMLLAEASCIKEGIRMIDVRHEQAAALMGAGLQPAAAEARRLHGGERSRRHQPHHRPRQRAGRLRAGRRDRRLEPDRPVRPAGVPGDRPGRDHEAAHQVGRPRLQPQAHPRAGEHRLPAGDDRQARPGLSRSARRRPLRRRSTKSEVDWCHERPADPQCAPAGRARAGRRADRWRCRRRSSRSSSPAAA